MRHDRPRIILACLTAALIVTLGCHRMNAAGPATDPLPPSWNVAATHAGMTTEAFVADVDAGP